MVSSFTVKPNESAASEPQTLQFPVLPQIQSYFHEANEEMDFARPFAELSYRNEGFNVMPHLLEFPVVY